MQLSIDPAAGLVVAAPARTPQHEIDAFVRSKARWVRKALRDADNRSRHLTRAFVTGESLPYLGRLLRLRVLALDPAASPTVELTGTHLEAGVAGGADTSERRLAVIAAIERWYRAQAEAVFAERVRLLAPLVGVRPTGIRVRAQKSRWGSCGKDGTIYLNWALIIAPPAVLDYLVVHELCHVKQAGHGRRFWSLVAAVLPDYEARRAELRRDGWRYRLC